MCSRPGIGPPAGEKQKGGIKLEKGLECDLACLLPQMLPKPVLMPDVQTWNISASLVHPRSVRRLLIWSLAPMGVTPYTVVMTV